MHGWWVRNTTFHSMANEVLPNRQLSTQVGQLPIGFLEIEIQAYSEGKREAFDGAWTMDEPGLAHMQCTVTDELLRS